MGYGNYIDPFVALRAPQDDNGVIPSGAKESYTVKAGEKLELTFVVLPGESRDIDVAIDLVGEGAEVSLKGLYLCGGDERVNFRILMHHRAPGCHSTQQVKGIAGGSAQVHFDGTIVVAPDAQQTEAFQENHNIVLTDEARVETKPQLEIYADDVKCSHGATIGQLNEEEQFYMRSRGIPASEAKVLQMISFVSEVIAQIPDPAQREDLSVLAEAAIRQMV